MMVLLNDDAINAAIKSSCEGEGEREGGDELKEGDMQYICISNARMQGLRLCLFFLLFEMDTLSAGVRVERGESRGSEREEGRAMR